jgi:hypothetical protein
MPLNIQVASFILDYRFKLALKGTSPCLCCLGLSGLHF